MTPQSSKEITARDSGRNLFEGILFSLQSDEQLLIPIHEIARISTRKEKSGLGHVELRTRDQIIRIELTDWAACRKLFEQLRRNEINHVREGSSMTFSESVGCDRLQAELVSLRIVVTDLDRMPDENKDTSNNVDLGFPTAIKPVPPHGAS